MILTNPSPSTQTSSAALDLAHIWRAASPQALYPSWSAEPREKSSEWPPFPSNPGAREGHTSRNERVADADTTPASAAPHIPQTPGTPRTSDTGVLSARITSHGSSFGDHSPISASDLGASLSCLPSDQFVGSHSPNGGAYGRTISANSDKTGSTASALRYGHSAPARPSVRADSKMGGLHGPKHGDIDIDRECKFLPLLILSTFIIYLT